MDLWKKVVIGVVGFLLLLTPLYFYAPTQFTSIAITPGNVEVEIRQQILDDLRTGNKNVSFPATRLFFYPNEKKSILVGIQNREEGALALKPRFLIVEENSVVEQIDVDYPINLIPEEAGVFAIPFTAPSQPGEYSYVFILETENGELWDSQEFMVKVQFEGIYG